VETTVKSLVKEATNIAREANEVALPGELQVGCVEGFEYLYDEVGQEAS
jgi:hypothetical protein